jgi:hypothetical protein
MPYETYLYNLPKVSQDGERAIPVPDSQVKEFASVLYRVVEAKDANQQQLFSLENKESEFNEAMNG